MLPKHFTFYVSNTRDKTYTVTEICGSDNLHVVCDQSGETFSRYTKETAEYHINRGHWCIITCIDDEETKEEIVKIEKLPDDFVFQIKESNSIHYYATRNRLCGERCMFLVEWHYDGQDYWNTYTEDELCNHFNNYGWKFVEQPKQSVVPGNLSTGKIAMTTFSDYTLKEAQAFCAANEAALPNCFKITSNYKSVWECTKRKDGDFDVCSGDSNFKYSGKDIQRWLDDGDYWIISGQPEAQPAEPPHEGPAYSLSEAQAFCAANGAALLISENKFILNHPDSGISYCVPTVEDLQRAIQWLRDYLEAKNA